MASVYAYAYHPDVAPGKIHGAGRLSGIPIALQLGLGLVGAAVSIWFFKHSGSGGTIDAVAMGIIGLLTLAVARRLFRRSLLDINISIAKQMYADTSDVVSRFKHINVSRRWVVTVPAASFADIRPAINELRMLKTGDLLTAVKSPELEEVNPCPVRWPPRKQQTTHTCPSAFRRLNLEFG
jgi:hypothetical protein